MAGARKPFVGRATQLVVLGRVIRSAMTGTPGTVIVHGVAGAGKTSLIEEALHLHPTLRVIRARSEPTDAGADFSLVRKLLSDDPDPPSAESSVVDVATRLLEVMSSQGDASALVVVADDLHCADSASIAALSLAAGRLLAERVVLICGVRAPTRPTSDGFLGSLVRAAQQPTGAVLDLPGLEPDEVEQLAREVLGGEVQPQALELLMARTLGNPLWVRATLAATTREELHSGRDLPVPDSIALEVGRRWEMVSPGGQELLVALAVLSPPRRVWEVWRLAPAAGWPEVREAAAAGLVRGVTSEEDPLDFTHPLVTAEVSALADGELAARLHLAAAGLELDPVRRMRHRLQAGEGADEALCEEATTLACIRAAESAPLEASELMKGAARRAPTPELAENLLLDAAQIALAAGYQAPASALLETEPATPSGYRDYLRAWLHWLANEHQAAWDLALSAWESGDPRADSAAWLLGFITMYDGSSSEAEQWATRMRERTGESGLWRALLSAAVGLQGRTPEALAVLGPPNPEPEPDAILPETVRGYLLLWQDDFDGSHAALTACALAADRHRHYSLAHVPLSYLADLEHRRGRWDDAERWTTRGLALLNAFDESWATAPAFSVGVVVPARRGDFERATARLTTAVDASSNGGSTGIAYAQTAAAQLAHAQGDLDGVLAAGRTLAALSRRDGVDTPGALQWRVLVAEAAATLGHAATAREHAASLAMSARGSGIRSVRSHAARAAALCAAAEGRDVEAERGFEGAAQLAKDAGLPFEEAMARLLLGEHLARRGQSSAVRQLVAAEELFHHLGATPFENRCAQAAGRPRLPSMSPDGLAPLTSQEHLIARMVAQGASNADIARELVLSRRTVEYHLANAFRKTGVTSRTQLARHMILSSDSSSPPT